MAKVSKMPIPSLLATLGTLPGQARPPARPGLQLGDGPDDGIRGRHFENGLPGAVTTVDLQVLP